MARGLGSVPEAKNKIGWKALTNKVALGPQIPSPQALSSTLISAQDIVSVELTAELRSRNHFRPCLACQECITSNLSLSGRNTQTQ